MPGKNVQMKKILVPTDFAEYAKNAFVYALSMADGLDAEVHLLHVIPPTSLSKVSLFQRRPYGELVMAAKGRMKRFYHNGINRVSSSLNYRPRVQTFVKGGEMKDVIMDAVKSEGYDLLVMGTKGRRDDWSAVFGSSTAHLIANATCPTLVIPSVATHQVFSHVCIGSQDKENAIWESEIAWLYGSNKPARHFVNVKSETTITPAQKDRESTTKEVVLEEVNSGNVVAGLLEYAKQHRCDLLLMKRSSKSWFTQLFTKSFTREAVLDAEIPVLVL